MKITITNDAGVTQQCKGHHCWGFRFEKNEQGEVTCVSCKSPYSFQEGEVEAPYPRVGMELWDRFNEIQRYSFFRGGDGTGTVLRQPDKSGNWIESSAASELIEEVQSEINSLKTRLERLEPKAVN